MEYLLKVSAVVVIFYLSYKVFLQRHTFFKQNRWFLLLGLITSFAIPFFVIPIYIEYTPVVVPDFIYSDVPLVMETTEEPFNLLDYLPAIYAFGVLCFSIRFIIQLASLGLIVFKNKSKKQGAFTFVETNKNTSPFSFFNWIVYNPNNFTETELEQIITHEKVHARQYHSVDILLTQLATIMLWFNPFIWLYNKALKQNLEFIADQETQKQFNCNKSYQNTLLKTSLPTHQSALTNNFYTSLIKKRIVMLHKSKSKKINLIKYAFVIPLLAIFLMSFNTEEIYVEKINQNALNESFETKEYLNNEDRIEITINKNTSDKDLKDFKIKFEKELGLEFTWGNLKRNIQGEITSIEVKLEGKQKSFVTSNANDDNGIQPFMLYYNKADGSMGTYVEKADLLIDSENSISKYEMKNHKHKNTYHIVKDIINQQKGHPLYLLNGNEITQKELKKVNDFSIISITNYNKQKAIEKY